MESRLQLLKCVFKQSKIQFIFYQKYNYETKRVMYAFANASFTFSLLVCTETGKTTRHELYV